MRIIFMVLMILVLNYYLGLRLFQGIKVLFPKISMLVCVLIFVLLTVIMIAGFIRSLLPLSKSIKYVLAVCSSYVMGFYLYLLMFCLFGDLILLIMKLFNFNIVNIRLYSFSLVFLMTCIVVIYGLINANNVKHVSYDVDLKGNKDVSGMNIVMVSDLHIGAINSNNMLKKVVKEINNLNADLVLIPGDIFDNDYYAIRDVDGVIRELSNIKSKYGVYASLGNHDSGSTFDKFMDILEKSNVKVLMDESVVIDDKLEILGRIDGTPIGGFKDGIIRGNVKDVMKNINGNYPLIVMDHNPININEYDERVNLIVSGHTHKGQIFPANIITNKMFEVDYGYYLNDKTHVIVSSGAGTWSMPMRVGSNCEIVSINVR